MNARAIAGDCPRPRVGQRGVKNIVTRALTRCPWQDLCFIVLGAIKVALRSTARQEKVSHAFKLEWESEATTKEKREIKSWETGGRER